jgi:hypothetical protein
MNRIFLVDSGFWILMVMRTKPPFSCTRSLNLVLGVPTQTAVCFARITQEQVHLRGVVISSGQSPGALTS